MQRSNSLQSSLKPVGARSSGKSVRFADCHGAALTKVRHVSADNVYGIAEKPSTSAASAITIRLSSFSSNGLSFAGVVQVINPHVQFTDGECLVISFSSDDWTTCRKILANQETISMCGIGYWHFYVHLKDLEYRSKLAFKVEYRFGSDVIIDDNNGEYYRLQIGERKRKFHHSQESVISDLLSLDRLLIY